jgi:predicted transcriptional regulator
VSNYLSKKRQSKNVSSQQKASRLVSEVVNEVLNFIPNNSSKIEESKNFHKSEEENCINTIKSLDNVTNIIKDLEKIKNIPVGKECTNTLLKCNNGLRADIRPSINIDSTSSDGNGSYKLKRSKLDESSSNESEICNLEEADELKLGIDQKAHIISNSNYELLNRCKGVIRAPNKVVLVDFISPRLLENPSDVHRVMINILGFKVNEFVAITKNKINKCYSFLIFEEPVRAYLNKVPDTEAGKLVPWNTDKIKEQVSLSTIISLNATNTAECHVDFKKTAKKLLNCLLGNNNEQYEHFCYNKIPTVDVSIKEAPIVNDSRNHNDLKTSEAAKNCDNSVSTIVNVLNGKNRFKRKIFYPSMSAEEEKQKQFFQMMKSFFSEDSAMKEANKPQKSSPANDREKAKNKILERCLGTKSQGKKIIIAMVGSKSEITSYKEIKDVLILLFGIKPNEFCGLTKSNFAPSFNLLIEEDAYLRYRAVSPYPEIGMIRPWDDEDLKVLVPELAIVCASTTSTSKNTGQKKLAKNILEHIRSINQIEMQQLIILSHSDSQMGLDE